MESKISFKQMMILLFTAAALLLTVMNFGTFLNILGSLISYILPLFVGACIAFAINVPMKAFERMLAFIERHLHIKVRHTLNTYISMIFTFAAAVGLGFAFANFMVPQLTESVNSLIIKAEDLYPKIIKQLNEWNVDTTRAEELFENLDLRKLIDVITSYFSLTPDNLAGTIDTVISAASKTVSAIITVFSTIVFSVYMLTNKKKLNVQARKLIYAFAPKKTADYVCKVGSLFYKTFYSFISSQCLEAMILATMLTLAMLVARLPYAGIVGIITCVLALIPYIGAFIAGGVGTLLVFIDSPGKALLFLVIYFAVQQIEEQLIYPHIVGGSVGLPPMWTLFAALVGGKLLGVFGLLCFIPLTAVIYALIKESAGARLSEKGIVVESPVDSEEREKQRRHDEIKRKRKERRARRKNREQEDNY